MTKRFELRTRFAVDDGEVSDLHRRAFGAADDAVQPCSDRLNRHSLTWIGAFDDQGLIGFVNVCWDGGAHAFVLDTAVDPAHQRIGIGHALVRRAATEAQQAGCTWLDVEYEPHLRAFYEAACGFRSSTAGVLRLGG
jgi:GNAT superfamily N-acetyltransferase